MEHFNYIKRIDGVMSPDVCDYLMSYYQTSTDRIRRDNGPQHFGELNIGQVDPVLNQQLSHFLIEAHHQYSKLVPGCKWMGPISGVEGFRVKCYTADTEDQFGPHVDVGDLESCKRYLAFLFYLNDDFKGGHTIFMRDNEGDYIVSPKKGSVVVFPPNWQFPHVGTPVKDKDKYIMSSYLNYT